MKPQIKMGNKAAVEMVISGKKNSCLKIIYIQMFSVGMEIKNVYMEPGAGRVMHFTVDVVLYG